MRLLLFAVVALGGCAAPQWYHPTASRDQFMQDRYQCTVQSNTMYPVVMVGNQLGPPPQVRTNCTGFGNQLNCTSQQAYQMPTYQYDRNQPYRDRYVVDCLYAKGYSRQ